MEYSNRLEYKGFIGTLIYEAEHEAFFGEVIDCIDVISYRGDTRDEAVMAFAQAVEDYLEFVRDLEERKKQKRKTKTKTKRKRKSRRRK